MKVKIYSLTDPTTNLIRYIGRTKNSLKVRLSGHKSKAKSSNPKTHKDCWILSLAKKGLSPIIEMISEVEGWEESYKAEQQIIKDYLDKGFDLTNTHDKGIGGLLRVFSDEQREKISKSVKKLHEEGKLLSGRKSVDVYDLEGNFLRSFPSHTECAKFIGISDKHIQNSMRRNSKRLRQFQIRHKGAKPPGKWEQRKVPIPKNYKTLYCLNIETKEITEIESVDQAKKIFETTTVIYHYINSSKIFKNKYILSNARVKLDELLENPTKGDYQQPSLSGNTFEGSTTNSRVLLGQ